MVIWLNKRGETTKLLGISGEIEVNPRGNRLLLDSGIASLNHRDLIAVEQAFMSILRLNGFPQSNYL
jgi:hypothetical protein